MKRGALEHVVTTAIVANAAVFAWGLIDHVHAEQAERVEHIILAVFVAEMLGNLYRHGWRFFRSPGHLFDLAVTVVSLAPLVPGAAALRVARLARVAKLLHLARHTSQLRMGRLVWRRVAHSS